MGAPVEVEGGEGGGGRGGGGGEEGGRLVACWTPHTTRLKWVRGALVALGKRRVQGPTPP